MMRNILKSLMKPDAYPEPTLGVELVQTHVSYIFLTDHHAYKIKKPVDFGFLNFSTIDRRRFYCNEEVRLNRRLCPDMYIGVVELCETASGVAFHGNGQTLDYAVKMKRLPAERMLDKLVESNSVSSSDMRKISRLIADFHRTAAISPAIAEYGRVERIMFNWQENFEQSVACAETTLPANDRLQIQKWVVTFATENRQLFEKRASEGFIRECDGDIHLENICLDADAIRIFDCIEFNERFRFSDTAADIAFLLMDLDYHRRPDLADDVISEYVAASGDSGVSNLIDFYKIYRAFVRGKVESLRMKDAGIDPNVREQAGISAVSYFRLACGYIARRCLKPTLFLTCGLMGVGKSTFACQLGFELGIAPLNSDIVRKKLVGRATDQPVISGFGEGLYSRDMTDATYTELLRLAALQLEQGSSAIVDASFIHRQHRELCAGLAHRRNIPLVIIQISCSGAETRRRLVERQKSGSSPSDGRLELLEPQSAEFEPPDDSEGTVIRISAALSPAAMTRQLYERLGLSC